MMSNAMGAKHWVGFKPQAAAGSEEATVTTFLASDKVNLKANPQLVKRLASLTTGQELPGRVGMIMPSGSASVEVHASQPHPWYWALGANATTTPGGTTPRLHTITEADAPIRLTCEADMAYTDKKQGDVYIGKLVLNAKPGEQATLEIEWVALSHAEGATLTSVPAFTTDLLLCNSVSLSISGSENVTVDGCQITYDGKLEQKPTLVDTNGGEPQVIRRKEITEVTGKLDFIDFPTAELTKFIAGTAFALIVELQGDVIETTYKKFLRVTLPACQHTGGLDEEAADQVMTGSADFKAFYDTVTARKILVEAQNTITAINT